MEGDEAGFALNVFSFAGVGVEGFDGLFDGAIHGGNLLDFALELRESVGDAFFEIRGNWCGRGDFAFGIEGGGGLAETKDGFVDFGFEGEVVEEAGGVADGNEEEAGGERIEGAGVSDALGVEGAAGAADDIV